MKDDHKKLKQKTEEKKKWDQYRECEKGKKQE
jgi:hypothetical protein